MSQPKRTPITVDRILDAAETVAGEVGMTGVSMRNVARALGVEAMSLYHHIENKERLLDAMADRLSARIATPDGNAEWRDGLRSYARSQFDVLSANPWGLTLLESRRQPGPSVMQAHESVLACLSANGFTLAAAASAFSIVDSYVRGFVMTLSSLPFEAGADASAMASDLDDLSELAPHLAKLAAELTASGDYDYAAGFGAELEAVLAGIAVTFAPGQQPVSE